MLERYAMKVARTVLRGGSGSNVTPLPDPIVLIAPPPFPNGFNRPVHCKRNLLITLPAFPAPANFIPLCKRCYLSFYAHRHSPARCFRGSESDATFRDSC
jgi:hypothetical protein